MLNFGYTNIITIMKNSLKKPVISALSFVLAVLTVILILFFFNRYDWATRTALKHMQNSPFYDRFHDISNATNDKLAEIFLEIGNYAWGGYNAVLIIETQTEVKLYSYLLRRVDSGYLSHKADFKFCESTISRADFMRIFNELSEKGVWKLNNNYSSPGIDDGATFFLKIMRGKRKEQIIVYAPRFDKRTKHHWDIIKVIIDFCMIQECA